MKPPLTYGLTHLAIAVRDLERTMQFYEEVFDMEIMYKEEDMIQLRTRECNDIIVFEKIDKNATGSTGGIAHFGFRLREADAIEEMHERLIHAGATIIEKGEFVPGSPYIFFNDPDGYKVEIWYELLSE